MASGNIFTLMINDGKQDALLNATKYLQNRVDEVYQTQIKKCMNDFQTYFNNPSNKFRPEFGTERKKWMSDPVAYCANKSRVVRTTIMEISKTHKLFVGAHYKPFVAMAFSYFKINNKEGSQKFSNEIKFTIPQIGTWVHDMVLHVRLTELRAENAVDKVKYCSMLGHRLLEKVSFQINGVPVSEYTSELYNKFYQFHVTENKKRGWSRNIGQEIPNLAYVTPDPRVNEYREYRWFGNGPQTFKFRHDDVDMYIPLLFWFNLDAAQAFPIKKIPSGTVKVSVKFADVAKLVACADYGGGGKYVEPSIAVADLHVNHVNTLPEIENVLLKTYDFTMIRLHKTFEKILTANNDSVHLHELKFLVEHMVAGFRPLENYNDVDVWHRNTALTPVDVYVPVSVMDVNNTPILAINAATYYNEDAVIDQCGVRIKDIEVFQTDTVKKYSSLCPYAAIGLNTPEDQGWLLFSKQFRHDIYDPSGHIDMSRNRDVYLEYTSGYISDTKRVKLTIMAQVVNFLIIIDNSAHLKFI